MRTLVAYMFAATLCAAQEPATRPQVPRPEVRPKTITATRPVVMFTRLEQGIMAASDAKDKSALQSQLAVDFQFIQPSPSESPLSADQWMGHIERGAHLAAHRFNQMAVHAVSSEVAIASFVESLKLDEKKYEDFFVVDYWQVQDGIWKLKVRYSSPVIDYPHDAPKPMGKQ